VSKVEKYYTELRKKRHKIKIRKANLIGYILHRNCLLKYIIEGKLERRIEVREGRGRRSK